MAKMFPDYVLEGTSAGERKLFAILQNLPDDCIVYHNPVVGERHPDFVVIIPCLGVLVIEVKGWYLNDIIEANNESVTVSSRGRDQRHRHPLRQARDYLVRLWDECAKKPFANVLYHVDGEHKGRFTFPWGHFAVLSNINRAQLEAEGDAPIQRVFGVKIATRDEFHAWSALNPDDLKETLKAFFDPWWRCQPMNVAQIRALRGVIDPIGIIKSHSPDGSEPIQHLKLLDLQQERLALSIRIGHRVIYGVAGSGKTVVLIARAKVLAQDVSKRVLVLCYNRVLADALRMALQDFPDVATFHFHRWGRDQGVKWDKLEDNEAYGDRVLRRLRETGSEVYDAVLIDEAQDFSASWFKCAKQALKEPDDGDLLIVGDGSQILYKVRGFTWASVGISAQGRTTILKRNYRNTSEIMELASRFASKASSSEDEPSHAPPVGPDLEHSLRRGPVPILNGCNDRDAEITLAATLILAWTTHGIEIRGAQEVIAPRRHRRFLSAKPERRPFGCSLHFPCRCRCCKVDPCTISPDPARSRCESDDCTFCQGTSVQSRHLLMGGPLAFRLPRSRRQPRTRLSVCRAYES